MIRKELIPEILSCTDAEQTEIFEALVKSPAVKSSLFCMFEEFIATSELQVLKRLSALETALGFNDPEDEDEDEEPTIPDQIKALSEKIENASIRPQEEPEIDLPVVPETTLERKAYALVEHLKEKVQPRNNQVFLNSKEIVSFMKTELPEDLRLKDVRNPRQAKKDVLEKAVKLFSDTVMIITNLSGNKVKGIALKPSAKRKHTDTCY